MKTYLAGFDKAEKIARGMAGDEKYHCVWAGEEFLLRIADGEDYEEKKREFAMRVGMPNYVRIIINETEKCADCC